MDTHLPDYVQDEAGLNDFLNTSWQQDTLDNSTVFAALPTASQTLQDTSSTNVGAFNHFGPQAYGQYVSVAQAQPSRPAAYATPTYHNNDYTSQFQATRTSSPYNTAALYGLDASSSFQNYQAPVTYPGYGASEPSLGDTSTISPQSLQYDGSSGLDGLNAPAQQAFHNVASPKSSLAPAPTASHANYSHGPGQQYQSPAVATPVSRNGLQSSIGHSSAGWPESEAQSRTPSVQRIKEGSRANSFSSDTSHSSSRIDPPVPPSTSSASTPAVTPPVSLAALRSMNPDLLNSGSTSRLPSLPQTPFLAWTDNVVNLPEGLRNTMPRFHYRRNKSGVDLPGMTIIKNLGARRPSTNNVVASSAVARPPQPSPSTAPVRPPILPPKGNALKAIAAIRKEVPVASPSSRDSLSEQSTSEDESADQSDESEDEVVYVPMTLDQFRGVMKPTDPQGLARWDTLSILWQDPLNQHVSHETIKTAMQKYGLYVGKLRSQIKASSAKIEDARTANDLPKVAELSRSHQVLLDCLRVSFETARTDGFPDTVRELGSNEKLTVALIATLVECSKAEDYTGSMPLSTLGLLTKFTSLTDELLKRSKFESIKKRWAKKGDAATIALAEEVMNNTVEGRKRSAEKQKDEKAAARLEAAELEKKRLEREKQERADRDMAKIQRNKDERARREAEAQARIRPLLSASKRPRDGDEADIRTKKKMVVTSASDRPLTKPQVIKRPASNLLSKNLAPTPKPAIPKAPPKKPVVAVKSPEVEAESKFGALLDSINKPPPEPKRPQSPERPPETPEEKARRLRKESRRHLRVKFREGAELEQVRFFRHEIAEDEGRAKDMLRDVFDTRSEGMMLKERQDDADADDDEEKVIGPYTTPVETDLGRLSKATRHGPTFVSRGGTAPTNSAGQRAQEERQNSELMVIYNDHSEIPATPKEPSTTEPEASTPVTNLPQPTSDWLQDRLQLARAYGPAAAKQAALVRIRAQQYQDRQATRVSGVGVPSTTRDLSVAHAFQYSAISSIVTALKGKTFPPAVPPEWMDSKQKTDWWAGYNRDTNHSPAKPGGDPGKSHATQPPMMFPSPSQAGVFHGHDRSTPATHDLSLRTSAPGLPSADHSQQMAQYVAAMTAQNPAVQQNYASNAHSANPPDKSNSNAADFDMASYIKDPQGYMQQLQAAAASQQPPQWLGNHHHHGPRAEDSSNGNGGRSISSSGNPRDAGLGGDNDGPHAYAHKQSGKNRLFNDKGEYVGKKRPCTYWLEGKCVKGAKCTFLHEKA